MGTRCRSLAAALFVVVGLMGMLMLLPLFGAGHSALAQAGTGVIRVATTGTDIAGCGGEANPCRTLQYAVNTATPGDEIRVAAGTYTGVQNVPQYGHATFTATQLALIYKNLTVRGGYLPPDWNTYHGQTQPTILDAQSMGRVVAITGTLQVKLEGLYITGGRATYLGGYVSSDAGGGIYAYSATVVISDCQVYANQAVSNTQDYRSGYGGGIFVYRARNSLVVGNSIRQNTAAWRWHGHGGGVYIGLSDGTRIEHNVVVGNIGTSNGNAYGGGLNLYNSQWVSVTANEISDNVSGLSADAHGGGLYAISCYHLLLADNWVRGNSNRGGLSTGGGVHLGSCNYGVVTGNRIDSNTANRYKGKGGGIYADAGRYLEISSNLIRGNLGSTEAAYNSWGGGIFLTDVGPFTLTNNALLGNRITAAGGGAGLYVNDTKALLLHNTLSGNSGGDGSGICITGTLAIVTATNTLVANQTIGVSVPLVSAVTFDYTLWYNNTRDRVGTVNHSSDETGDPKFAEDGYHIRLGSAALNQAQNVGVVRDIDGHTRPQMGGYDIGADEMVIRLHLPVVGR